MCRNSWFHLTTVTCHHPIWHFGWDSSLKMTQILVDVA